MVYLMCISPQSNELFAGAQSGAEHNRGGRSKKGNFWSSYHSCQSHAEHCFLWKVLCNVHLWSCIDPVINLVRVMLDIAFLKSLATSTAGKISYLVQIVIHLLVLSVVSNYRVRRTHRCIDVSITKKARLLAVKTFPPSLRSSLQFFWYSYYNVAWQGW